MTAGSKRSTGAALLLAVALGTSSLAMADGETRSGNFAGLSNHATSGNVTLEQTAEGHVVVLGDDFSFDGAPDPKVAFGKSGDYDASTLMGPLQSNSGEQRFTVPDGIDVTAYDEVYIWCETYSVGLGVASLK